MSGINRFGFGGVYVLHSDHEAEVARLRADLEGYMMGAAAEAREVDARGEEIKRLRAELQNAAKAALDAVALSCEKEREADALRVGAERWQHARKLFDELGAIADDYRCVAILAAALAARQPGVK